jgi:hypothetical protein
MLRGCAMFLLAGILAGPIHAQQLVPATKWATGAQKEFSITSNIVYQKANNVELRLDLITTGKPSVPKPTCIFTVADGSKVPRRVLSCAYFLICLAE